MANSQNLRRSLIRPSLLLFPKISPTSQSCSVFMRSCDLPRSILTYCCQSGPPSSCSSSNVIEERKIRGAGVSPHSIKSLYMCVCACMWVCVFAFAGVFHHNVKCESVRWIILLTDAVVSAQNWEKVAVEGFWESRSAVWSFAAFVTWCLWLHRQQATLISHRHGCAFNSCLSKAPD